MKKVRTTLRLKDENGDYVGESIEVESNWPDDMDETIFEVQLIYFHDDLLQKYVEIKSEPIKEKDESTR